MWRRKKEREKAKLPRAGEAANVLSCQARGSCAPWLLDSDSGLQEGDQCLGHNEEALHAAESKGRGHTAGPSVPGAGGRVGTAAASSGREPGRAGQGRAGLAPGSDVCT